MRKRKKPGNVATAKLKQFFVSKEFGFLKIDSFERKPGTK